jgi:hypothetical protein
MDQYLSTVISIPAHCSELSTAAVSYFVTSSDRDSNVDSISDPSNAHISDDDDGDDTARELCDRLRANDPRGLDHDSNFIPFPEAGEYSEGEQIVDFQALEENTRSMNCTVSQHGRIRACNKSYVSGER